MIVGETVANFKMEQGHFFNKTVDISRFQDKYLLLKQILLKWIKRLYKSTVNKRLICKISDIFTQSKIHRGILQKVNVVIMSRYLPYNA